MQIDVFNGDADGICALVQLRLAEPLDSQLISGPKREIDLLERVSVAEGDCVTVLDISLEKNRSALDRVLAQGASVFYVDHHQAGVLPEHPRFKALIDTDAEICTSLLVDRHLQGQYRAWAVTAAFGDNLIASAEQAARDLNLSADELKQLNDLGVCINYNGYGANVEDLHFPPEQLFKELVPFATPFAFMRENKTIYQQLLTGYADDMALALAVATEYQTAKVAVYILPDAAWSRRISGVFGNELANRAPDRAHAVLSYTPKGDYQVSVRAPLTNKTGADDLCSAFATGGGRKAAAGINHLPIEQLPAFITAFAQQYP